jgi:hypothetical protein
MPASNSSNDGRWGGASLPMTLMNRLCGDWRAQPYAATRFGAARLERIGFADLLKHLDDELYRARTRRGGLQSASSINLVALGSTTREALETYPSALAALAAAAGASGNEQGARAARYLPRSRTGGTPSKNLDGPFPHLENRQKYPGPDDRPNPVRYTHRFEAEPPAYGRNVDDHQDHE